MNNQSHTDWFPIQNPKIRPKKMHFPGYLISGRTQSNLHSNVYHIAAGGRHGVRMGAPASGAPLPIAC